ncbi:MerR family transcriptional regulator [Paenibacillus eucommiae]|uniref:AdoMet-dependent methyltransferase n=1 Tax=Paenibacillus eucommiae TaxID=1355755 RepID=A0ABS4J4S6_9BACL|nr:MerR family transcriptional regulator [Paenibacillus eucommiae]MBP1994832.1 putative AdoMet-dependent methyltransferase [Paenibacillus eucommiae]
MKINDLAKRLNVTPRAIRLYEKKGLIKPERGAENGYRYYTEHDAWRLQTIASLREIGLGLDQIQMLLEKFDQGNSGEVHHYLEMQRMAMVANWVERRYSIHMLDELILRFEAKQGLHLEDLFQLAENLKQIQKGHSSWQDKWDFDRLAGQFDPSAALFAGGPFVSALEYEKTLEFMVQWVAAQPSEQGLDIGTGTGNLAGKLLAKGASMHAIDQSKEMLARCREKFPGLSAKLGNALSIPVVDKQFHFVVTAFAFHHLDEIQQILALEEMNRILKPNGRICISGLMYEGSTGSSPYGKETVAALSERHPANRLKLLEWFQSHDFITVQHQINEWIHVVYAVRKH